MADYIDSEASESDVSIVCVLSVYLHAIFLIHIPIREKNRNYYEIPKKRAENTDEYAFYR